MDVVEEILSNNNDKYNSVTVNKYVDVDVGALLVLDNNNLDSQALSTNPNDYILTITRNNAQILFNHIWDLPKERVEESLVAKLPRQKFKLPRCKPIPTARPLTKWEQFAKEKGIVKKPKSKLTWDKQLQKWIPLYGFKRAEAEKDKDWLIEVPQNADPLEDQFAKKDYLKSENVAKNELQRLRNIAKAKNIKIPRFGVPNPENASAKDLQVAVTVAKSSTASLGKFQDKLPKEKEARGVAAITPGASRKRKPPPVSVDQEKSENLVIADTILNKRPKLDVEKIIAKQVHETDNINKNTNNKRKKNVGKKSRSIIGKKPKNLLKGKRVGKTKGGRKRR